MDGKGFNARNAGGVARQFLRDKRGSAVTIVAIALPFLLGFAGLACEFGYSLVRQSENQRVADMAAYAGAIAYSQAQSEEQAQQAAWRIGALNGLSKAELQARIVPSPRDPSSQALKVDVKVDHPLYLSRILYDKASITIATVAYAQAAANDSGCMLALDQAGSGITLSGGTSISAAKCTVQSNAAVAVPCGTYITAKAVTYGSAVTQPCGGVKGPNGAAATVSRQITADPLDGSTAVAAATSRFKYVSSLLVSDKGGPDVEFGWNQNATKASVQSAGCSATFSGSKWTVTCDGKKEVKFGNMTMGGGITLDFCPACAGTAVSFSSITVSGAATFGPGNYEVARGITVTGGSSATFAATAGNSYRVGTGSGGAAISLGGAASLVYASGNSPASAFEVVGSVNTGGGSCLALPPAAQHDVDGSLDLQGAAALGAGTYSVNGFVALGASSGGVSTCLGRDISLEAKDVSLVVSGKTLSKSGQCAGYAFCLGAGYRNAILTAPASGDLANIAVIGPQTTPGGMALVAGASNFSMSGVLYFPRGPIVMDGGASAGSNGGGCLQMIATTITLRGGTTVASSCELGGGKGGNRKVRIVQ